MFGLRFVSFAVAALLCGTINVVAAPLAAHPNPAQAYGEIATVAPDKHLSGETPASIAMGGAKRRHPHILLERDRAYDHIQARNYAGQAAAHMGAAVGHQAAAIAYHGHAGHAQQHGAGAATHNVAAGHH